MNITSSGLPMPAPGLKTDIVRTGEALVCVLSGDLHTGTRDVADQALRDALDSGPGLLAVDLDAVELFTADGLNLLLTLRDTARSRTVPLILLSPSRAVRTVLDLTGAVGTFTIHVSLAEATTHGDRP
ncbi:STAS domain-containing protein [Streptomyces bambusae]|uniref:STAS domain-containing protein n=1 Tax=Streptomyces bambusae TaxID=1550616 RepID=UPI001CFCD857|nr:STAS domain-containing protein [Streptomyces bambusae]MCB5164551.1 STAS domain-containing protein [Streptomyces bambusae]